MDVAMEAADTLERAADVMDQQALAAALRCRRTPIPGRREPYREMAIARGEAADEARMTAADLRAGADWWLVA